MRNLNEPPRRERDIDTETTEIDNSGKSRSRKDVLAFHNIAKDEGRTLLAEREASDLRSEWDTIMASFIDDPRTAVEDADKLVSEAIQRVSQVLTEQRSTLAQKWINSKEASTEDLRQSLQYYRALFSRLLSI